MRNQIDLVTVCFADELKLLELQARSIRLYFDTNILGSIHIVINDRRVVDIRRYIESHVFPEYGAFRDRVHIYGYRDFTKTRLKKLGWRSQQLFKLISAQVVQSPQYLILDCKNHFIRPVREETFWYTDGRLRTAVGSILPKFQKGYMLARSYFGLDDTIEDKKILPTVTPFLAVTDHVLEMILRLEREQHTPIVDLFMKGPLVTEFYLYYAYIEALYGGMEALYYPQRRCSFSLMAPAQNDLQKASETIENISGNHVFGFGVHRAVIEAANPAILGMVADVWVKYGLVASFDEAQSYFDLQCLPPKRWFWFF